MRERKIGKHMNYSKLGLLCLLLFMFSFSLSGENSDIFIPDRNNQLLESAGVPVGFIGLWSGPLNSIPIGWTLCNGNLGSPDLRGRFVQCVNDAENPGSKGGWNQHNHTYTQVPQHTHTITDPGHAHNFLIDNIEAADGVGVNYYVPMSINSVMTGINTTGVTIDYNGIATCETENSSSMPPYYELAYIMKYNPNAEVPIGLILLWPNQLGSIPSDWALCDGTQGTPQLGDRFALGVQNSVDPGATGGWDQHNHTYAQIPYHNHGVNDPGHSHLIHYEQCDVGPFPTVNSLTNPPTPPFCYSDESQTGISVDDFGVDYASTNNISLLPSYYYLAFVMKISGGNSIPKDLIGMWSNTLDSVPTAWAFCNGTSGTIDMRNRFPIGCQPAQDPGMTGGTALPYNHRHSYSQVPKHSHSVTDPGHMHQIYHTNPFILQPGPLRQFVCGSSPSGTTDPAFTGITLQNAGAVGLNTGFSNWCPPYYRLAYIQHRTTEPEAHSVSLDPDPALTNESLDAIYTFFDIDGDGESGTRIRWYLDDNHQPLFDDLTQVHHMFTNKSDNWYFTVQPSDGIEFGNITQSQTVTIQNAIPYVTDIELIPSNPNTTSTLELSYTFVDPDDDPDWSTIRWYKDGVEQTGFINATEIPGSAIFYNEKWNATITPYDGEDYGDMEETDILLIENTPPEISNLLLSPAHPTDEMDLVLTYDFSDDDGHSDTDTLIRWFKDNVEQITYENDTIIPASATSEGEEWNATVTPYDGIDQGSDYYTNTITIESNTPPDVDQIMISPGPAYDIDDLIITYTYSDINGHEEGDTEIIWYCNNVEQPDYENETWIPASATSEGDQWNASIRPFDGYDFGTLEWCPIREISVNDIPTFAVQPNNITYVLDTTGHALLWTIADTVNREPILVVLMDNSPYTPSKILHVGSQVSVDINDLDIGVYIFNLTYNDGLGRIIEDIVEVKVTAADSGNPFDNLIYILIGAVLVGGVVGIVKITKKKGPKPETEEESEMPRKSEKGKKEKEEPKKEEKPKKGKKSNKDTDSLARKCSNCGKPIEEQSGFCPHCGAKLL